MFRLKMVRWLLLALGFAVAPMAQAQYYSSVRGMLNKYLDTVAEQCAAVPSMEQNAQGDEYKLAMSRQFMQYVCKCQPEKTQALIARLSEEELATQIYDESEFLALAKPNIIAPCMGELTRGMFQGEQCKAMKNRPDAKLDVEVFCPCMSHELPNYSDIEAMNIGLEYADYIPAAAAADKAGTPRPERSALLLRLTESLKKCGAKGPIVE